jgi:uncharacterized membrane protein YheB (UPF0754 family)
MDTWSLVSIPLIAALIGWITNYIAVKMIFRPRRPVNILGIPVHGLIPRRQKELAMSIAETVERDLVSHKDVQEVLKSPAVEKKISEFIEKEIDTLMNQIGKTNPMVAMVLQGDFGGQIKKMLGDQMQSVVPGFLEQIVVSVEEHLDFKTVVRNKVENLDLGSLEDLVYRISAKELKTIEYLGGVLGFLVGLVQVALAMAGSR